MEIHTHMEGLPVNSQDRSKTEQGAQRVEELEDIERLSRPRARNENFVLRTSRDSQKVSSIVIAIVCSKLS